MGNMPLTWYIHFPLALIQVTPAAIARHFPKYPQNAENNPSAP
jgi:hypothetical protein